MERSFSFSDGEKGGLLSNEICQSGWFPFQANSVASISTMKCASGLVPEGALRTFHTLETVLNYFCYRSSKAAGLRSSLQSDKSFKIVYRKHKW
jgi:hypothetical protein